MRYSACSKITSISPALKNPPFAVLQASGSPVRKNVSNQGSAATAGVAPGSATARASASASAQQQLDSHDIVDLCHSPLPPARLASTSGPDSKGCPGMQAAPAPGDGTNQVEMMDISQSPVKNTRGASGSKAAKSLTQGSKVPMLGLAMTAPVSGSADPYWQRLSDLIVQGGIGAEHADELRQVFAEEHHDKWRGHVPAYLLSGDCHRACTCCQLTACDLQQWLPSVAS